MITVHEVSKLTRVSVRTLQYYDKIGLLHPAKYTDSGYRLYDDAALVKLQQILLFRELEFPLKDINPDLHTVYKNHVISTNCSLYLSDLGFSKTILMIFSTFSRWSDGGLITNEYKLR